MLPSVLQVAVLQSVGAAGFGASGTAVLGTVGGVAGAGVASMLNED